MSVSVAGFIADRRRVRVDGSQRGAVSLPPGGGTRARRLSVGPQALRDDAPASAEGSDAEERELLLERFAGWHDPIPAIIEATAPDAIIRTPLLELTPLPAWTRGRVALLGDAAHAMLPSLGQGGCQAIEDAAALGRSLRNGAEVPEALRAYEHSRKPRADDIARQSRRMSAVAHLRNPAATTVRNLAMRAAPAGATMRRLDALVDVA